MFRKFIDILPVFLSEKDRRSVEPFLWGEEARASNLRKRALDLMGKEEDRDRPS